MESTTSPSGNVANRPAPSRSETGCIIPFDDMVDRPAPSRGEEGRLAPSGDATKRFISADDKIGCFTTPDNSANYFHFPERLHEGVILARPNRFIMDVDFGDGGSNSAKRPPSGYSIMDASIGDGSSAGKCPSADTPGTDRSPTPFRGIVRCHCPAVSRIGGLDLAGRPCLVSDSHNSKRKMPLTVEAFSFDEPDCPHKHWVGINQNASNRYVEHFLKAGAFPAIAGKPDEVRREVKLGDSRLDFLVDDRLYLEVKTPLVQMQTEVPGYVPRLPEAPFSSTGRAMRHLRELAASLEDHERAVVLYCLYYQNYGFRFYHGTTYEEVLATVDACRRAGVELWQADFEVTPEAIALKGYHELTEW